MHVPKKSSCFLLHASVRAESGADACEQVILTERLCQVELHAGSKRARPHRLIRIGRDQNGGNGLTEPDQSIIQFRPRHFRHLHIRDQAGCAVTPLRTQKVLGGRERHRAIAERSHETCQSLPNRFIVVDDGNREILLHWLTLTHIETYRVQPLGAIAPRRPFIVQVKDQIPVRYIAIILWYRLTGALEGHSDEAFATGGDGAGDSRAPFQGAAAVDHFLGG